MSSPLRSLWLTVLLGLLALLAALPLRAATPPVLLDAQASDIDVWPQLRLLPEGAQRLDAAQALARLDGFAPPRGPASNLGLRPGAVWLHLPLRVAADDPGRWLLDIDYPSLDRIEVYVAAAGEAPALRATLGDTVPRAEGKVPLRSHVTGLGLQPGRDYQLLLRVEASGTMLVPVRLMRADQFYQREAGIQLLQGLAAGLALCLCCYTLAQWVSLRERGFLYYGVTVVFTGLFNLAYFGLARQHLWPDQPWLVANALPLLTLLLAASGVMFLERILMAAELWPRMGLAMRATSVLALLCALAFAGGQLSYRQAHGASSLLSLLAMGLALPVAWTRMRSGDRALRYLFIGWAGLAVGIGTMTGLQRGLLPMNGWTSHAWQLSGLFEMLMWQLVLGERIAQLRQAAEHSLRERELLHALAHTDALTGLPNRRGLQQALQAALPGASAQRLQAVFLMDLDGFKAVNDRLGHDAGDLLLQEVARRLRDALRGADVVARLGGDEFVALALDLPSDEAARALADKLLRAVSRPYEFGGQTCRVGLTIGYALAPLDGRDVASLLKRADAAMYAGKQDGKHCVRRGGVQSALTAAA